MRIFAATAFAGSESEAFSHTCYDRLLVAYPYRQVLANVEQGRLTYRPGSFVYDSGAFTVWRSGGTVDVDEYAAWCLERAQLGGDNAFVNLDVIPGDPHRAVAPTRAERTDAAHESQANADVLRSHGIPVMEVFHRYEPLSVLHEILDRRQPGELLGIGGLVGRGSSHSKVAFCDSVWAVLRDRYGWDGIVRVHGLGIAPDSVLGRRYPWYSIDSTSWNHTARFGRAVTTGGRITHADTRTTNRDARKIYYERVLRRWQRLEDELAALWAGRGVTYMEEAAAWSS